MQSQAAATQTKPDIPYWRLSGFYFFYFALLGALFTYWGLYLKQQGYSIAEIGTVMASLMVTKIIAPNIWGWLGDKLQNRLLIVRAGAFLTLVIFAAVLLKPGFIGMVIVMMGFSFFWNAILPQQEVVTLNHMADQPHLYSRVRVWGSIGFIVTSVGFGLFFDYFPINWLPYILLGFMVAIWISTHLLYESSHRIHDEHSPSFMSQLLRPTVLVFFLLCFLMQFTHGPYYAFFLIYMEDYGYSKFDVGLLIGLGVLAEVLIFLVMHRLMVRFSIKAMAVFCFLAAAIRWVITALYPDSIALIILAQLAHASTFGIFHAICIHLVSQYFSPQCAGQGQALYSALSFGAGGAIGAWFAGQFWNALGAQATFLSAAIVAVGGALLALWKMTDHPKAIPQA
ncbi:MAG: MFS transporter [Gammaproteobacteria bacterium]|nr:MAG: MFS transporter [Gammaproteobacteria bacterium]